MIYLIYSIYIFITSGQTVLDKAYRQAVDDENMKDCITFLVTIGVAIIFYSVLSGFRLGLNTVTAIYALIYAAVVCIATSVNMRSLENADVVTVSLFSNAGGMMWDTLFGTLIFREMLTWGRLLGLVLIMITIIIPFFTTKKNKTSKKGLFWCCMRFLTGGLFTLVMKMYSQADGVLDNSIFCLYTNVFMIPFILYLLRKKGTVASTMKAMFTKYKKPFMIAVLSMTGSCISTLIYMYAIASIDLIVLSVLGKGLSLIVLSLLGFIAFKERITISKVVCMILSVVAVAVTIV